MTLTSTFNCALPAAWRVLCLPLAAAVLLTACGGGGGGSSSPTTPTNQPPVAAAKLGGEAVLQATTLFDITGTADVDGSITSRSWAYGDGQTGSADSHIYTATGSYVATLTVTDNSGVSASTTVQVTVAKCSSAGTQDARRSPFTTLCVQTSRGEMVFELYAAQAPLTTANFLRYVDKGFYSGLLFHRVLHEGDPNAPGGVIQSGGFLPGLVPKVTSDPAIPLESNNGLKNSPYTIGMARLAAPDSATSQFYINPLDNHGFDYSAAQAAPNGYAVFGLVISGTSVVDAIASVATTSAGGLTGVPVQNVLIRSIVRLP